MQNILCHTVIQDHIFKGSSFKCRSWSNLQCQTVVSNIILHAISGLILQTNLTKMPFLYLLKQKKKKKKKKLYATVTQKLIKQVLTVISCLVLTKKAHNTIVKQISFSFPPCILSQLYINLSDIMKKKINVNMASF